MAHEINDSNYEEMVMKSDKVVMLDFWAEWCGPCRMLTPIVEEMYAEFDGKAVIGKVNVDENPDVTAKLGIRNIPTIMFFKNGEMVDKVVGATAKANLVNKLNSLL
ncbi:MAG: thioredoxin [Bacteroidales bacterium]|jgi:thioredoxin 1|nr:thioredoxin [Bacteroidales bacterium]